MSKIKWFGPVVAVVLLALAMGGPTLNAKGKPGGGGGGGGGGETPAGTVYFRTGIQYGTMASDGTSKTPLPLFDLPGGVEQEPSKTTHGGRCWFLEVRNVAGTYPDGSQRLELFAVRDDANEDYTVQLTNSSELEVGISHDFYARWSVDPVNPLDPDDDVTDGVVSWSARRWQSGQVVSAGIYEATVLFDGAGNVVGLSAQPNPASPLIELDLVDFDYGGVADDPDITGFDWSPDGTQVVFSTFSSEVRPIHVFDSIANSTDLVTTDGWDPSWSPASDDIAFTTSDGIEKIASDGSGQTLVVDNGSQKRGIKQASSARWSPDGTHLIYQWWEFTSRKNRTDVFRVAVDGSGKMNLTQDLDDATNLVVGWR